MGNIHIVKLAVGAESLDDMLRWEAARGGQISYIRTRNRPTRWEELLDGGSLYWVIKGVILCRREIISFDQEGDKWRIGLKSKNHLTEAQPRRPFQGWRYLKPEDAPRDISEAEADLPAEMRQALREAGVW